MFSINYNLFYRHIQHDVRCSQIGKERKKHPVYKDKSETRRKVVIVRGTLV